MKNEISFNKNLTPILPFPYIYSDNNFHFYWGVACGRADILTSSYSNTCCTVQNQDFHEFSYVKISIIL